MGPGAGKHSGAAKKLYLLSVYFAGVTYAKTSKMPEKMSLSHPRETVQVGLSDPRDLIKVYKARPIQNPRPVQKAADYLVFQATEALQREAPAAKSWFYSYAHHTSELQEYDVVPEKGVLSRRTARYRQYKPTTGVATAFLRASEQTADEFRKALFFLPKSFLRPSGKGHDTLLKETATSLAEVVQGALQTIAYRAAAFDAPIAQVSEPHDFIEPFKRILYECLPVRLADMETLLKTLCLDLEAFASCDPVIGPWGSLHNGPTGMFVRVLITLPPKTAPGGSIVVGGIAID